MQTVGIIFILATIAITGISADVRAQGCDSVSFSIDQVGIQTMYGMPGDTVWAKIWTVNDSAILAAVFIIRFDTTILKPIPVTEGSADLVIEPFGRFAGSEFLVARKSTEPEDSGAVRVLLLPQVTGEDTVAAGSGIILRMPLIVQPAANNLDWGSSLTFPRYTRYLVDSTSTPPETLVSCEGTEFVERSAGPTGMSDGFPWPDGGVFYRGASDETTPSIDEFVLYPRSAWQGDSVSVGWWVNHADSIVVMPDIGMHPSSVHTMKVVVGDDTPTDYTLTAFGNGGSVSRTIRLLAVPNGANRYPWWNHVSYDTVMQWEETLQWYHFSAADPDGNIPLVSVTPLPATASLIINQWGSVTFSWRPALGDTGYHDFSFVLTDALDSSLGDTMRYTIYVRDGNQLPTWTLDTSTVTMQEAETLVVPITTADADGIAAQIEAHLYYQDTLATNMNFVDNLDGTGALTFIPDYLQGNTHPTMYAVSFTVRDGAEPEYGQETPRKVISVFNRNSGTDLPKIVLPSGPGPFTTYELDSVKFEVRATTTVGDRPELTASPLPPGGTFTPYPGTTLSDRMVFRFLPPEGSAGEYSVTFTATNGELVDEVTVDFTVGEANRAPFIVVLPGESNIYEEDTAVIKVVAWDPDSTVTPLTAFLDGTDSLATNMTFVDSGNGVGVLTFVPNRIQAPNCDPGFYYLRFRTTDVRPPYPSVVSSVRSIIVHDSGLPCCVGKRGDVNYDGNGYGAANVADLTFLVLYFRGVVPLLPCFAEADLDGMGTFNVTDITTLVDYLFRGAPFLLNCPPFDPPALPPLEIK